MWISTPSISKHKRNRQDWAVRLLNCLEICRASEVHTMRPLFKSKSFKLKRYGYFYFKMKFIFWWYVIAPLLRNYLELKSIQEFGRLFTRAFLDNWEAEVIKQVTMPINGIVEKRSKYEISINLSVRILKTRDPFQST